jgi:hypothetical protein
MCSHNVRKPARLLAYATEVFEAVGWWDGSGCLVVR